MHCHSCAGEVMNALKQPFVQVLSGWVSASLSRRWNSEVAK